MASSIYELVNSNIKVPDGLMYRGKYCGKSKLRQRLMNQTASTTAADGANKSLDEMLSSVVPRQDGRNTVKPKSRKMDIPLKG